MARTSTQKNAKKKGASPIFIINRHNIAGWLIVGVMACGLMFVTGVMVGRNTMPIRFDMQQLDEKLANLKQSVLTTKIKAIDVIENLKKDRMPEAKPHDPYTLEPKYAKSGDISEAPVAPEALGKGSDRETGPADKPASARGDSAPENMETTEPGDGQPPPEQPVETKTALNKNIRDQAAASQKTKRSTPYEPTDGYAIQVASLKNSESAYKVRDRFLGKGYPAYCSKASVNGTIYHRVRIGPYPNREKARKDFKNLTEAGVNAMIFLIDD